MIDNSTIKDKDTFIQFLSKEFPDNKSNIMIK